MMISVSSFEDSDLAIVLSIWESEQYHILLVLYGIVYPKKEVYDRLRDKDGFVDFYNSCSAQRDSFGPKSQFEMNGENYEINAIPTFSRYVRVYCSSCYVDFDDCLFRNQ